MLTTAGRSTVRRLAVPDLPRTSTNHVAHGPAARQTFLRNLNAYNGFTVGQLHWDKTFALGVTRRLFATAAAAPVKPKKSTATKATTTTKITKATKKTTSKSAKKPAVKRKTAAKKKAPAKKKKATPKKRTRQPLTAEQKEKAGAKKQRDLVRELKAVALEPPKPLPHTVYMVLCTEIGKQTHTLSGPAASAKYKSLTPSELEHYNHIANQNKLANEATMRKWVESHTPNQILIANKARMRLNRLKGKQVARRIRDDRQVKRPTTPCALFTKERWDSGDFHNMKVSEALVLIGQEYKALPESEKKRLHDEAESDRLRFEQESKTVYGSSVSRPLSKKSPPATS